MKPPWANARSILNFFGGIRRSCRFGCEGRAPCAFIHGLTPMFSAKADKVITCVEMIRSFS